MTKTEQLPLSDQAVNDAERRLRLADMLKAQADRPHAGDDLSGRTNALYARAESMTMAALRDLGAVYRYTSSN